MNKTLQKLGISEDERVVIIHADDLGMNESALTAYADILATGLPISGSVMVPCPWFPKVAAWCKETPQADVGVHVTLTSEWPDYRWRPLTGVQPEMGLVDSQGYFFPTVGEFAQSAKMEAAVEEVQLQISTAINAGVNPSHYDWHMLAISQRFDVLQGVIEFGVQNQLFPLFLNWGFEQWSTVMPEEHARYVNSIRENMESQGIPLVDHIEFLDLQTVEHRKKYVQEALLRLKPGLSFLSFHPAVDTADLRKIAPDWKARVSDHEVFADPGMQTFLKENGIIPVTCRQLQAAMKTINN